MCCLHILFFFVFSFLQQINPLLAFHMTTLQCNTGVAVTAHSYGCEWTFVMLLLTHFFDLMSLWLLVIFCSFHIVGVLFPDYIPHLPHYSNRVTSPTPRHTHLTSPHTPLVWVIRLSTGQKTQHFISSVPPEKQSSAFDQRSGAFSCLPSSRHEAAFICQGQQQRGTHDPTEKSGSPIPAPPKAIVHSTARHNVQTFIWTIYVPWRNGRWASSC